MAPLALVKNSMAPLACGGMWLLLHRHTIEVDRHAIEVALRQLLHRHTIALERHTIEEATIAEGRGQVLHRHTR